MYLERVDEEIQEIRSVDVTGDLVRLAHLAHAQKGVVALLGAHVARDLAAKLEAASRVGDVTDACKLKDELVKALSALRDDLRSCSEPHKHG